MSVMYTVVDHRAPWYVPRGDPATVSMLLFGASIMAVTPLSVFTPIAFASGGIVWIAAALLGWVIAIRWFIQLKRYMVRIPDDGSLADYHIKDYLPRMQRHLRNHPSMREVIEPVLVASYGFARQLDERAVSERYNAIRSLVADVERDNSKRNDDSDLEAMRRFVQVRQQMRKEGLL